MGSQPSTQAAVNAHCAKALCDAAAKEWSRESTVINDTLPYPETFCACDLLRSCSSSRRPKENLVSRAAERQEDGVLRTKDGSYLRGPGNVAARSLRLQIVRQHYHTSRRLKDSYDKIRNLGAGNFGEVRLVQEKCSGNLYAAKVFYKPASHLYRDGDFNDEEVKNEVNVMRGLCHPNIVSLHQVFEEDDRYTLLLDYAAGGDLKALLRKRYEKFEMKNAQSTPSKPIKFPMLRTEKRPSVTSSSDGSQCDSLSLSPMLPSSSPVSQVNEENVKRVRTSTGFARLSEEEAAIFITDVLAGVAYLHAHGIAHRDLKLDNLFLRTNDKGADVLLGDFGFARTLRSPLSCHTYCGSPVYMAPEVVGQKGASSQEEALKMGRRQYGLACDLWSVGVILAVFLTGEYPIAGRHSSETLRLVLRGRLNMERPCWRGVSDQAKTLVLRLLQRDPILRPSAISILAEDMWLQFHCPNRVNARFRELKDILCHEKLDGKSFQSAKC